MNTGGIMMFLWFAAYILIPVYTILFVQGNDWLTTNFSVIGNIIGKEEEFALWGLMVGIYFFCTLQLIVARMPVRPPCTWLIPLSLLLLTCAIITPYLPQKMPLGSWLHVMFSFTSALCLLACLGSIIGTLYHEDHKKYRLYPVGLAGIGLFSLFLLCLAGIISSALEIFFTIASTFMVYRLYRKLV